MIVVDVSVLVWIDVADGARHVRIVTQGQLAEGRFALLLCLDFTHARSDRLLLSIKVRCMLRPLQDATIDNALVETSQMVSVLSRTIRLIVDIQDVIHRIHLLRSLSSLRRHHAEVSHEVLARGFARWATRRSFVTCGLRHCVISIAWSDRSFLLTNECTRLF